MKNIVKILASVLVAGVVAVSAVCSVSAAGLSNGESRVLDELNTTVNLNGTATKCPQQYINQAENYFLLDYVDITDAQADEIIGYINDCKAFLESANVSTYGELTDEQMAELVALANKASGVVEVTLVLDRPSKVVTAYDKHGNVIGKATTDGKDDGVIKTTGADVPGVVCVAGLGILLVTGAGVYLLKGSKKETADA